MFPFPFQVNNQEEKKKKRYNVLISKALIDSCFSHDEFISINNVLKEYDEIKEKI